jgi:hypothetical protein
MSLPEKEWFTLEEIAQRWGCSVEDLWHYAEINKLRLSVVFSLPIPVKWHGDPQQTADYHMTSGPLGLPAFTAREAMSGHPHDIALFLPPVLGNDDVYGFSALDDPECPVSLKLNVDRPIEGRAPLIARAERDRFEREHNLATQGDAAPPPPASASLVDQWKSASPEQKRELGAAALRQHGTQEAAAKALGITRQRLGAVLRRADATVVSPFPASPWKPRKR